MLRYKYKTHNEIPRYMQDYILSVSRETDINNIPVDDINDFLNGLEDWERDRELTMPARVINKKRRNGN